MESVEEIFKKLIGKFRIHRIFKAYFLRTGFDNIKYIEINILSGLLQNYSLKICRAVLPSI